MSDDDKLARSTRHHLEQIPDLFARLPQHIRPGSRPADPDRVSTSTSPSRPPVNLDVLDLLDDREKLDAEPTRGDYDLDRRAGARRQGILPTLSSWVRLVDSERWDEGDEHQNPPTQRTVAGECGWLIEALDWIGEQRWLYEFEDDLGRMVKDMKRALGDFDEGDLRLSCLKCGWTVEASPIVNGYRCTGCEESWSRIEMHKMAERKRPRPLKECADITGHPHRTLRYLVNEGKLRHVARDGNRNLYDLADVAVAFAKTRLASA